MDTDTKNRRLEALGIAESIAMRLRDIGSGLSTDRRTADEYAGMARTLGDIEDRLYRKGEYAPENACNLPPLPLAVITHMKKVAR
jgi:hypothetical protein